MKTLSAIRIRGARQNNLKNIDIDIPLNQITVITGVSGCGKSSLAFDTLYAEGQRRYVETFSPYARQFMDRMDRPQVDRIEGIPPALAIDRKAPVRTSRSTVGTMTELTDYVKLLFARRAVLHCHRCHQPVQPESAPHIWQQLQNLAKGAPLVITFPISPDPAGLKLMAKMGYDRHYADGRVHAIDMAAASLDAEPLDILADRLKFHPRYRARILDSLEQAFAFGQGRLSVWRGDAPRRDFSRTLSCAACQIDYPPAVANLFSFNSPVGACPTCRGFGRLIDMDKELIVPNPRLSIRDGAIKPWGAPPDTREEYDDLLKFCKDQGISTDIAWEQLPEEQRRAIMEGKTQNGKRLFYGVRGFFNYLERKTYKMHVRVFLSRYRSYIRCPDCQGGRFNDQARRYQLQDRTIDQIYACTVDAAHAFFNKLNAETMDAADGLILTEIISRLTYLQDVGLGYLTLDRQSRTLSGGEVQRTALASALGASLVNTLYVLDEPSIGLHARDTRRLIGILQQLRDQNNTIVVVEHDPDIIRAADYRLELGPRAGEQGGHQVYFGPAARFDPDTLTGAYLSGQRRIPRPAERRQIDPRHALNIIGARHNNLKTIDVRIPLNRFVCLTGVSGSGKSTLAESILYNGLLRLKNIGGPRPGVHQEILGHENIDAVELVDQRPIGRTPRANLLTYSNAMTAVRNRLADTDDARRLKLKAGHFSFNTAGGRCPTCKGEGHEKIEMQFLADVYVTCPACQGRRFTDKVLQVRYNGKNIDDILNMTVSEAIAFLGSTGRALQRLQTVGLDYLRLGQPLSTLSGGEAQRLKLSRHLKAKSASRMLFIFDEPTTGLHFNDIEKLLAAFDKLVEQGHSLLVIEHNLDVIEHADWVIDLGPQGGEQGGQVVAAGTPEAVADCPQSQTGHHLQRHQTPVAEMAAVAEPAAVFASAPTMRVNGATAHNLKNISLDIPRDQLVVVTGLSGSGKSTLAFDILFAEGQRRYLDSITPYVRQYIKTIERPEVDHVTGVPPAVAIEQRIHYTGSRSTVATLTEIYHFLRLLFSKLGQRHCPQCGINMATRNPEALAADIQQRFGAGKARLFAPHVFGRKGFHRDLLEKAAQKGIRHALIDGQIVAITPTPKLDRYREHDVALQTGTLPAADKSSLHKLISHTLAQGQGTLILHDSQGRDHLFSIHETCPACGISLETTDPRLFSFNSAHGACPKCEGTGEFKDNRCPACQGSRLCATALAITVNDRNIWDIVRLPAAAARDTLEGFQFNPRDLVIAGPVMSEMINRLNLLLELGLGYLPLGRSARTLSGGEAQRVRLAAQLGSNLRGAMYVLDEPTIGLHPRDTGKLIGALKRLRDRGNTVLMVEHDADSIAQADTIVELGPGAGDTGGQVVAIGTPAQLKANRQTVTAATLQAGSHDIISPKVNDATPEHIEIIGACANNLKQIDVKFPLNRLICVTGVSGSGKSSLLKSALYPALRNGQSNSNGKGRLWKRVRGANQIDRIIEVDHSPIGRTPRSVPASYVGILDDIRGLFAHTRQARANGWQPGRFSFNTGGGRCEACKGQGRPKVSMSFLPDVYVPCETCRGSRYNPETLSITYGGQSIAQVLDMTFETCAEFFSAVPKIRRAAQFVHDIGLGYLKLGQPSPTLSGGEAQRIRLARHLAAPGNGHTFFILDEPTTGLHRLDVKRLIDMLQRLVDAGHTVAVIEHNLDLIAAADHIIDLGPDSGDAGGQVVAAGTPAQLMQQADQSVTARYLAAYLAGEN